MKNSRVLQLLILLPLLWLLPGHCQAADALKLGADGYGKMTLANGTTVLVSQDKTTSLSAATILIGGGVLTEKALDNGISNLMIKMLLKGNSKMSASQITERLDFLGARVSAECYRDYTVISFESLSENFDKVFEIISASLLSPTFPAEEMAKLKIEVEGDIKAANDHQGQASSNLFWRTACGEQGYGLPVLGSQNSIAKLTVEDLRKHFQKYFGGKNLVVAVATDLPAEELSSILQNRLSGIGAAAEQTPVPSLKLQAEKNGFLSFDRNQSFIYMGFVMDRLEPKEICCVNLLNQVMGANVGSRLWDLRQKEKLAYTVYTHWGAYKYVTVFRSAIGTDTAKVTQALTSLNREWTKLQADGITEAELADARVNMKNSLIFSIDTKAGRANTMAINEYLGYGYRFNLDQIAAAGQTTLGEINDFVKKRLSADRKYVSIVGKK